MRKEVDFREKGGKKVEGGIWRKILCYIGFHKWKHIESIKIVSKYKFGEIENGGGKYLCLNCGKTTVSKYALETSPDDD